jgi:hypothetical protein
MQSAEVDIPRIMEQKGKIRHEGLKRKLKLNENKMNKPYEVLATSEMRQVVSHMTYLPTVEGPSRPSPYFSVDSRSLTQATNTNATIYHLLNTQFK